MREADRGKLFGREGAWSRRGVPSNGAKSSQPHSGWVGMGGRLYWLGYGGGDAPGKTVLVLDKESRRV